jgi:bla regulator protein BlaR1
MTPTNLSAIWAAVGPALGNHLWQSTLFAITAGLLTLSLRKNYARARYWLWLAASVKFLIPFSLLIGVGGQLASPRGSVETNSGMYIAIDQISRPFTQPMMAPRVAPATASPNVIHLLPPLLTAAWLGGLAVVLVTWYVRWRRITAIIREAAPLRSGREVETLRRLERMQGMRRPIEMLLSQSSLEPGIFGIAHPVLIWPEGISEHLEDAHLEAILAHELGHVRRRDNLAAAIHMLVESIFWFHPLVWWLGARLLEERERACDEHVLELGSEPTVYAESILKTCEFCLGSPLPCVSGVTGADLKKRIVLIMTQHVARKLDFTRRLLLSAAGLTAIAVPVVFGLLHASRVQAQSQPQGIPATNYMYDVASIKPVKPEGGDAMLTSLMAGPDNLSATNCTLQMLIRAAYGIQDFQISGAPDWLRSDLYNVEAKMDSSVADAIRKLDPDQRKAARQQMAQALLADRFKLSIHRGTKELPVYVLVVAKNGPKLQEAKPDATYPNGIKGPDGVAGKGMMRMGPGELTGQGLTMASLARLLSQQLGRTVIDKTGLTANYDFTLHWTPEEGEGNLLFKGTGSAPQGADIAAPSDSGPSIFTAIQEQLGLKLESQKGPVEIIVIDHIEKPSQN